VDFYEEHVLPVVFDRLDAVFPELGLKRTGKGWTATNREATQARFGARPDRVVCNRPGGFLVHGTGPVSWLAYLKGGTATPRGADFVEAVKTLASAAGVDCSPLERELTPEEAERFQARQRRGDLLENFVALTHEALLDPAGKAARAYLMGRTFREDELEGLPLGFYAGVEAVSAAMRAKGYSEAELAASGIMADGRWAGRLLIPWRDARGRVSTVAARDLTGSAGDGAKYLYLKGGTKPPAFGLDVVKDSETARRDCVVLVEGLLDVVLLHARGMDNVAALGGSGGLLTADRWTELGRLNARPFVLALDSDEPGREGTLKALTNLRNVDNVRNVYVLPPDALGTAKDPDELVREKGVKAFHEVIQEKPRSWGVYMGENLLEGVTPASDDRTKREAVRRILDFEAGLRGPLSGLDSDALLDLLAERTGYDAKTLREEGISARERRERERAEDAVKASARELQDALGAPGANVYELASDFSARLASVQVRADDSPPAFSVEEMEWELKGTPPGMTSGWDTLDELKVRFRSKELAVLAARTGHGKTTALVNLLYAWMERKLEGPLVYFSHEEPPELIYARLLSRITAEAPRKDHRWNFELVRDYIQNRNSRPAWPHPDGLSAARERVRAVEKNLHIVHRPSWGVGRISAHVREIEKERGVGAVFVDYIQRVPVDEKGERRDIEVSAISRGLKALAVDLFVPVVAGAQVNRQAAQGLDPDAIQKARTFEDAIPLIRKGRPSLHQLREGGIEQEADLVLGLMNYAADFSHNDQGDTVREAPDVTRFEIGVLKNRYGQSGKWARLAFEGASGLIRDRRQGEGDL
jgi:DNA primase